MIWHGISMNAARYVANSIRNNVRFSAWWLSASGPVAGASNALHAFRLQANDAITMCAQLLTRSSTGTVGVDTGLEFRDQILLVTTIVGLEDDLVGGGRAVVGDIKEVAKLLASRTDPLSIPTRLQSTTTR